MPFCPTHGLVVPCAKCKKGKDKRTPRSQNFLKQSRKVGTSNSPEDWVTTGPNVPHRNFSGQHVTGSLEMTAEVTSTGSYYSTSIKDICEVNLPRNGIKVFGIIFRMAILHSDGILAGMTTFDPTKPTAPTLLSGKRFKKASVFGVQFVAPKPTNIEDIPSNLRLVLKFDEDFTPGTKIFVRDVYFQHSAKPELKIPNRVLYSDGTM